MIKNFFVIFFFDRKRLQIWKHVGFNTIHESSIFDTVVLRFPIMWSIYYYAVQQTQILTYALLCFMYMKVLYLCNNLSFIPTLHVFFFRFKLAMPFIYTRRIGLVSQVKLCILCINGKISLIERTFSSFIKKIIIITNNNNEEKKIAKVRLQQ